MNFVAIAKFTFSCSGLFNGRYIDIQDLIFNAY